MNPRLPQRRQLRFNDLDDVLRDVDALRAGGYEQAGRWDLGQTCWHLSEWLRFPVDGFPRAPAPVRLILWALRHTVGRRTLRRLLASGTMAAGGPTLRESVPPPAADEAGSIDRLRQAIERFRTHAGPLHPSPLFGRLDRETAMRLQLVHCAHHLGFLSPKAGPA